MPESGDSGQNGTRIRSFNSRCNRPRSSPLSPASTSNCHSPFKHSQSERTNCGRGYSERGIIILAPPRKGVELSTWAYITQKNAKNPYGGMVSQGDLKVAPTARSEVF